MSILPPDGGQAQPTPITVLTLSTTTPQVIGTSAATESLGEQAANQQGAFCLAQPLTLSFGWGAKDNQPTVRTMTFGEFIDEFSTADTTRGTLGAAAYHALDKLKPAEKKRRNQEKDGTYFVAGPFAGDGRRCNENVGGLFGMALDFDSGTTTEGDIRRQLSGYAYLAYTSYSHRPELQKWRVFVPYREPIAKEQHADAFRHFQELFDGDVDPVCATPCQFWYTPACPSDAVNEFQSFHALGELYDPAAFHDESASSDAPAPDNEEGATPANQSDQLRRLTGALEFISADDRKTWVDFGMAIKHDLGEAGLAAWLAWSGKSPKFELEDALKTWGSFADKTTGPHITLGSIFYMARERGWIDEAAANEIPEHVAKINACYFLAPQGGKTQIFKEGVDPLDGRHTLQAMNLADFKALLSNVYVDAQDARGKHKRVSVAEAWLNHAKRRQYEGVLLAPNGDVPGYYNLWRGFAITPRQGSWALMQEHLRKIICRGDATVFAYVLDWLAFAVQYPDRQAEVALVMQGGRGSGKGFVARAVGSLFGRHFSHISQAKHLTGHFNGHLAACIVLFVDEAFWAGDRQGEGTLKHLITEPTMMVERKGIDPEMTRNHLHVIMASNSAWVVPAGFDERRFLVLNVDDGQKQNAAYFGPLHEELENGGREAMLFDLLGRDISAFNIRVVPRTAALIDQKLLSLEPHEQWYFEKLQSGSLTGFKDAWELVPKSLVHDNYVESLKKTGASRRSTETALGMHLRGLLPEGYPRRVKAECDIQSIPVKRLHYRFPPLDVCRQHFETLVGLQGYDWEGEDRLCEPNG